MPDEPQTLDQAMDAAEDPSAAVEKEETKTPEPQAKSNEVTPDQSEDSYTRIDPKTLSPELQAMHKSLLRDYTKKTQSIAQQRREFEEWKSQEQRNPKQFEQLIPELSPSMSLQEHESYIMAKVQGLLEEQSAQTAKISEQQYLDKAVEEVRFLDERLNTESPAHDEYMHAAVGGAMDRELTKFFEENGSSSIGFDYIQTAKRLIAEYEGYVDKRAQQLSTLKTKKAFESVKRVAPHGAASSPSSSFAAGSMSIDEALDNAFDTIT